MVIYEFLKQLIELLILNNVVAGVDEADNKWSRLTFSTT